MEKRGGHSYKMGKTASSATKRKELLIEPDPGTLEDTLHVTNLLPNDVLLSIALKCNINMGVEREKQALKPS